MQGRVKWSVAILALITILVYYVESASVYTYTVYEVNAGYGYQIQKGEKVLIVQGFIPTLPDYQPFKHKKHASQAAQLVVEKLNNKQVPALSKREIANILSS